MEQRLTGRLACETPLSVKESGVFCVWVVLGLDKEL
jgi:hypothetical protein